MKTPIKNLPEEALDDILNGTDERLQIKNESLGTSNYFLSFDGLIKYIEIQQQSDASSQAQNGPDNSSRQLHARYAKGIV